MEKRLLKTGQYWYKLKWAVVEINKVKMSVEIEYRIRKETTVRRPDVTMEYKDHKISQIIDKAYPSDQSFNEKVKGDLQKY